MQARGVPFGLLLSLDEKLVRLVVWDDESDQSAPPVRALCEERARAVALLDETLPAKFVKGASQRHARDAEVLRKLCLARKLSSF